MYENKEFHKWLEEQYAPIDDPYWHDFFWSEEALNAMWDWWEMHHIDDRWTDEQVTEYEAYLEFLKTAQGRNFPAPVDIDNYFENRDAWQTEMVEIAEWTADQRWAYDRYQNYANQYGDPKDWYPTDIKDYFDNKDVADEQLSEWQDVAVREYQKYRDFMGQRDPGEWAYSSLDDFVANYDNAMSQLGRWEGLYQEQEQWALPPEEQARRREESYEHTQWAREQSLYASKEQYRPEVQYDPAFYQQQEALQGESVYYQDWMTRMYPQLRQRFEATQPRPVGYPTREEARAAAERAEKEWAGWLGGQDLRQEFYGQAPSMRGERPQVYAPRMRHVSYG